MTAKRDPRARRSHASTTLGAFFFFLFSFALASCQDGEKSTPDWDKVGGDTPAFQDGEAVQTPPPAPTEEEHALRFVAYNLKNYLSMSRYQNGERVMSSKPEEEIEAVIRVLASTTPDVIGLCEIGTKEDLLDLQKRLKAAGVDLPHAEHAGGADDTRRLALLSRYPITATDSQGELFYTLEGERTQIRRGILDASVTHANRTIRFLGVHFKSKREIPGADQELIRRNEAYLLRKHADTILEEDPDCLLVAYGDFNDTRRSTTARSVSGPGNSKGFLEPLSMKDSRGEVWTHYWDYQHIYSRFDYILVSRALRPLVDNEASHIIDHPDSATASDHRALISVFRW